MAQFAVTLTPSESTNVTINADGTIKLILTTEVDDNDVVYNEDGITIDEDDDNQAEWLGEIQSTMLWEAFEFSTELTVK